MTPNEYAALHARVSATSPSNRRQADVDALNKYSRDRVTREQKNQARNTEPPALAAYLSNLPPMQAGRARKALTCSVCANGNTIPLHALIAQRVASGWCPTGDRLVSCDGSYLTQRVVTSYGLAYAASLAD